MVNLTNVDLKIIMCRVGGRVIQYGWVNQLPTTRLHFPSKLCPGLVEETLLLKAVWVKIFDWRGFIIEELA